MANVTVNVKSTIEVTEVTIAVTEYEFDMLCNALTIAGYTNLRHTLTDGFEFSKKRNTDVKSETEIVEALVNSGGVDYLIQRGHHIQAVKTIRAASGCSLRTAKDAADNQRDYLRSINRMLTD